jgi:hypothetical protein
MDHHLIETKPHIEDHNLFSAADGRHISSDFIVPADRDNLNIHTRSPVFR